MGVSWSGESWAIPCIGRLVRVHSRHEQDEHSFLGTVGDRRCVTHTG